MKDADSDRFLAKVCVVPQGGGTLWVNICTGLGKPKKP